MEVSKSFVFGLNFHKNREVYKFEPALLPIMPIKRNSRIMTTLFFKKEYVHHMEHLYDQFPSSHPFYLSS